ncbi:MAG: hypothetical protein SFV15_00730 [Polyangiaceae bacterium]|nr:hypothetical protein [Polyangiaceae bacterium]
MAPTAPIGWVGKMHVAWVKMSTERTTTTRIKAVRVPSLRGLSAPPD